MIPRKSYSLVMAGRGWFQPGSRPGTGPAAGDYRVPTLGVDGDRYHRHVRNPSVVSLFSGAGGLDHGFASNGFEIKLAVDHDADAVAVYEHNLGHAAQVMDVRDPGFAEAVTSVGSCDVLLGGFPCQGFSKAGPKREDDDRNSLYQAMIFGLATLRPSMFIAENVDGLSQNFSGGVLAQIVEDCESQGYQVEWRIVDAAWFGVPQHRRRIVIVGVREDLSEVVKFDWPIADHVPIDRNGERSQVHAYPSWSSAGLVPARTLASAIEGAALASDHVLDGDRPERERLILRHVGPGQKLCNARHDATSVRTWDIPQVFGAVSRRERDILETIARNRRHRKYGSIPNGNPLPIAVISSILGDEVLVEELESLEERRYVKRVDDRWDLRGAMFASGSYKRPISSSPSPTVLTSFNNPRFMAHPTEDRPFTVREVARLQTFPDDFQFLSAGVSPQSAYRLIGNAVPPLLARKIAAAVWRSLQASVTSVAA